MKKSTFLLAAFCFFTLKSLAQIPEPCQPGSSNPSGECETSCIHCNFINGFQGSTDGQSPSEVLNYCGSIENDQWFGFIASCSAATFTATPVAGSCTNGDGIQIALYPACGGPFLQCNVGQSGGGNTPVWIAVASMVPGQHYFAVIDGFAGDQCDFSISVIPPSCVQGPPVGQIDSIGGPKKICPGAVSQFCTSPVAGAAAFEWTCNDPQILIDGQNSSIEISGPGANCIIVEVPVGHPDGSFSIAARPKNACANGQIASKTVQIKSIPPSVAPLQKVCFEDCPTFTLPDGSAVACDTALKFYTITFLTPDGCDSLVRFPVQVQPPILTDLGLQRVCEGECFFVDGEAFCQPGDFAKTLSSASGCDSTVRFSLEFSPLSLAATANFDSIDCAHPFVALTAATPFLTPIVWRDTAGQKVGDSRDLLAFAPGFFIAISGEGLSCEIRDTVQIFGQLAPFSATATGGSLACAGSKIQLLATTTAQNPAFSWSGPGGFSSNLAAPEVADAGIYVLIVGENGCLAADTARVLAAPPAPTVSLVFSSTELTCAQPCAQVSITSSAPVLSLCKPSCAFCTAGDQVIFY